VVERVNQRKPANTSQAHRLPHRQPPVVVWLELNAEHKESSHDTEINEEVGHLVLIRQRFGKNDYHHLGNRLNHQEARAGPNRKTMLIELPPGPGVYREWDVDHKTKPGHDCKTEMSVLPAPHLTVAIQKAVGKLVSNRLRTFKQLKQNRHNRNEANVPNHRKERFRKNPKCYAKLTPFKSQVKSLHNDNGQYNPHNTCQNDHEYDYPVELFGHVN
jgi:hypothetical protein